MEISAPPSSNQSWKAAHTTKNAATHTNAGTANHIRASPPRPITVNAAIPIRKTAIAFRPLKNLLIENT